MITNERAIELLTALQEPEAWESQITDEAYEALEMAINVVKLQIPTKPIITLPNFKKGIPYSIDCPTCGTNLTHKVKRCWECGQLIDWSEYVF